MAINMDVIKELRTATGAGLADCKNALVETNGNITEAIKILQKKGLADSSARSNKPTSEGRVFIKDTGNAITIFSVKCETDFVANNELFKNLMDSDNLEKDIDNIKIATRENIQMGEKFTIPYNSDNVIGTYIHSDNKSGAVVVLSNIENTEKAKEFAHDCCLHLVAFTPMYKSKEDVPESYIAEKKEIFSALIDQDPKINGKPDNVKMGILNGKLNKHLSEICFLEQAFIKDDKVSVKNKLKEFGPNAAISEMKLVII